MTSAPISEYLNSNPLTEYQTQEFLEYARRDENFFHILQRISEISKASWERDGLQNEELEELGLLISNFIIRYSKEHQIPHSAGYFLKVAAEKEAAKDEN